MRLTVGVRSFCPQTKITKEPSLLGLDMGVVHGVDLCNEIRYEVHELQFSAASHFYRVTAQCTARLRLPVLRKSYASPQALYVRQWSLTARKPGEEGFMASDAIIGVSTNHNGETYHQVKWRDLFYSVQPVRIELPDEVLRQFGVKAWLSLDVRLEHVQGLSDANFGGTEEVPSVEFTFLLFSQVIWVT